MILTHGIPLSLYRDRHGIFQRNDAHWTLAEQLAGKQSPTQLGRALDELGIQQIPAYSPQAKGRIERIWRTFQTAWSELRLAGAATLPQANALLEKFCTHYNQRFARPAAQAACDFRPLPRRFDLPAVSHCTITAWSMPITPSPWVATPSPCHPCPATAAMPEKPSNSPISSTVGCASIAATRCSPLCPCRWKITRHAARRQSPPRRKEKLQPHASITLAVAPP